jgi:hypothetical protein
MEPKRRRELMLLALVLALGAGLYLAIEGPPDLASGLFRTPGTSPGATSASNGRERTTRTQRAGPAAAEAPSVHLDALEAERPKPDSAGRNLFTFKPRPAPPRPVVAQPTRPAEVAVPAGPPPPPPITLKFIGIVDLGQSKKIVAVLSDGRGAPVYGSEGETILGQYRILRIGTESIEMSYLDGRGRQTIRFTGS